MGSTKNDNLVLMGQIGAAHGIKGEVRIKSFTENPLDLAAYSPLLTNRANQTITIKKARLQKNMLVAVLEESKSRNDAEALNGTKLYVPRESLPQTEDEDEFYYTDLIGLKARTPDGEELGSVAAVQNYGAGDVLEIRPAKGPTDLYPFTKQSVPTINLAEGYLIIVPAVEVIVDDDEAFE
ncbi:ribosome maturation factor RimM [Maritalea myrionectae]|uniref:Ribosome maturation factor RimM n=1 Tax=Maritalea myrionectae TaxID=454601 RepID=A0A2R4MA97_9HYPH|nr:ribosome maturation factor RimM [Maritalea myrionectae]AVX02875.1 ribosome maturation factor RimM [Maritalea myrionectae]